MQKHALVLASTIAALSLAAESHAEDEEPEEDVWGSTFGGLALSVKPVKSESALGQSVVLRLTIRNCGDDSRTLIDTRPYSDYRFLLFDAVGAPVAKSESARKREAAPKDIPRSGVVIPLAPGEEACLTFTLGNLFKIEKEGAYFLMIMRRLDSWDEGFVVSNLARIKIAK